MQIIIPLTGYGSRFKSAGYDRLKPFIKIQGYPMINWVIKMFPEKSDITFVCRQEHLDELNYMRNDLAVAAPNAKIAAIKDWEKKGPVNDVLRAGDHIDDSKPVLISYCDYYMHWDYADFIKNASERDCDGAIPCYSGFHPNLLPKKNLYASCKVDKNDNLIEIKEKYSWEADKTKARHSPGMYYFKSGSILKNYCKEMIQADDSINGEFYMSLPYNYMVKDGLTVWCPVNVTHFCQWGTPEDLKEYLFWTESLRRLI